MCKSCDEMIARRREDCSPQVATVDLLRQSLSVEASETLSTLRGAILENPRSGFY